MLRSEEKEEQVTRSDRSRKQNGRFAKAFSNVGVRGFDKDRISLSQNATVHQPQEFTARYHWSAQVDTSIWVAGQYMYL